MHGAARLIDATAADVERGRNVAGCGTRTPRPTVYPYVTVDPHHHFLALVGPHRASILRFARRLEGDPVRAEDLLQQALLVAWRRFEQLHTPDAARAWLARITLTTWLDRRSAREVPATDTAEYASAAPGPFERLEARRVGARVADAVASLPEEQRLAVWLVDGEGFTFAEAALTLAAAPGTIASRVARGRASLRLALRDLATERGFV